ncbi:hypothetical protein DYB32_003287 [Aphanomyces invadans]|uniref:Glycoside hydrolase n=1 Tax=Aphanomyces invadans TaxID=157072 RepID=A0A3R6Z6L2_9STRA|nr:hypothetical protein DYB32_003287 [Aphanomyces invadans]
MSYGPAKATYPALADALTLVEEQPIAVWWSDNNPTHRIEIDALFDRCNASTVPTIVVYALPNKDCHASYSNRGFINSTEQYTAFVQQLATLVGSRPVIYILEPDAVGLATGGGCGQDAGYLDNMQRASAILTTNNSNAMLYVDVGYWMLQTDDKARQIASALQVVSATSRLHSVRGIVLNTANYRPVSEITSLCARLIQVAGNPDWRCVIDTSRNYQTPTTTTEWCNNKFGAIGIPPTRNTGFPNLVDAFLWIKIPGESDGECINRTAIAGPMHSIDAMPGPAAAVFFPQAFRTLWNQGYFVQNNLAPVLGQDAEAMVLAQVESKSPHLARPDGSDAPTTQRPHLPEEPHPSKLNNQIPRPAAAILTSSSPNDSVFLTWGIHGTVVVAGALLAL